MCSPRNSRRGRFGTVGVLRAGAGRRVRLSCAEERARAVAARVVCMGNERKLWALRST
jgi:hypothetical protein